MASKVRKVVTTLWDHKKKTAVGSLLLFYAGRYAYRWNRNNNIRSAYAIEAAKFGAMPISPEDHPRRLTVLANTSANERYVWDSFTANALPLFHLAGIQVTVLKSESESQMEALAGALDTQEADCVFIVGGEGTMGRVLTGIFNTRDAAPLPIGFFPGGYDNITLKKWRPSVFRVDSDIRPMCESAMALIEDTCQPLMVFQCTLEGDDKHRFSLGQVSTGWFKRIEDKRRKLWYWGGLKRRFAYFWEMLKRSPVPFELSITSEAFCPGCSSCRPPVVHEKPKWRWWHALIGAPRYAPPPKQVDYSGIVNERCGETTTTNAKGTEMIVDCDQLEDVARMRIRVGGEDIGRVGVMAEGWRRCSSCTVGSSPLPSFYPLDLFCRAVSLHFSSLPPFIAALFVSGDEIPLEEGKTVRVQTTRNTVQVYLPKNLRFTQECLPIQDTS